MVNHLKNKSKDMNLAGSGGLGSLASYNSGTTKGAIMTNRPSLENTLTSL